MIEVKENIKNFFKLNKINDEETSNREEKFNLFKKNGFPNKNQEDWKFIDLIKELLKYIPNLRITLRKK